jgi:DNA-binding transcriptional LysR family regulator
MLSEAPKMLRNLDTDLLRSFLAVAEANSFTKASELLFRTQAAVSLQIKRLEDQLGKSILIRGRRGLSLTPEGELLIDYARRILRLNDEVFANLNLPRMSGFVRIGAPDDYAIILLPEVLIMFGKAYPEMQVEVVCENSGNLIREVSKGNIDLALVTRPPGVREGETIRTEPLCWVTSKENSPHETDPLPLALFPHGCVCRDIALQTLRDTDRSWKIAFTSSTIAPILATVTAGLAITVMEECAVPSGTRRLDEAEGFPSLGTVDIALYRANKDSKAVTVLADHFRLCLKDIRNVGGVRTKIQ